MIAFQWPGKAKASPKNPWEYELVVLTSDVNGKKENVCLKSWRATTADHRSFG